MRVLVVEDEKTLNRIITEALETEITPGLRAKYNPALYSRIVQNLLQNAYKYGRENGHIRVRLSPDGAKTVLEVADDGMGVAPEDLDKVWQRFWQADPSHSEGGSQRARQRQHLHRDDLRPIQSEKRAKRIPRFAPCAMILYQNS